MKKLLYILVLVCVFSCDSEDANDCFQKAGNTIQQEVVVTDFEKIFVDRNIELILTEAPDFSIIIETGENLMNDVEAKVIGNTLQLSDSNTCNFVRDYEATKIYVSAPNITEIRSSTQYDISSNGVLSYPILRLLSENANNPDTNTIGDFRMQVNAEEILITANNISSFYLSGQTDKLQVGFYAGTGRFEGEDLIAQEITISHRGSNDMIVNPQQSLKGVLRGTGDLISKNHPPVVEIEQIYTGELIFQ